MEECEIVYGSRRRNRSRVTLALGSKAFYGMTSR